jgi:hypothetical protein
MERGAGRLAGRKGRAEQAICHFIEPMACLAVADVPAGPEWEYEPGRVRPARSLRRLLVPAPPDLLAMRPASPLVNSVKNDEAGLLDSVTGCGSGTKIT